MAVQHLKGAGNGPTPPKGVTNLTPVIKHPSVKGVTGNGKNNSVSPDKMTV